MHPQIVIKGYRIALEAARARLHEIAFDNGKDQEKLRSDLINIAKTTLSSKLLKHEKDHFATLAVDAVLRLQGRPNLDYIQVIKKAGRKFFSRNFLKCFGFVGSGSCRATGRSFSFPFCPL